MRFVDGSQHAGAVQVGVKQQPARATRHPCRLLVERSVVAVGSQLALEPLQGKGAGLVRHRARPPCRRNQEAEPDSPRFPHRLVGNYTVQARRAEDGGRLPRCHYPAADQDRRDVRQAGDHRRSRRQAGGSGGLHGHRTRHRLGGQNRLQQRGQLAQAPVGEYLLRVGAPHRVARRMAGVAAVSGQIAGQAETDPVLGVQRRTRPFQDGRLMIAAASAVSQARTPACGHCRKWQSCAPADPDPNVQSSRRFRCVDCRRLPCHEAISPARRATGRGPWRRVRRSRELPSGP